MTVIRSAENKDIEYIKHIFSFYYPGDEHYFSDIVQSSIEGSLSDASEKYLVALENEKLVGILGYRLPLIKFISYTKTQKPIELQVLFVLPEYSRKGIGAHLVKIFEKQVREQGFTEIILRSAERFVEGSKDFYAKYGFRKIGEYISNNNERSIMRSKILNALV